MNKTGIFSIWLALLQPLRQRRQPCLRQLRPGLLCQRRMRTIHLSSRRLLFRRQPPNRSHLSLRQRQPFMRKIADLCVQSGRLSWRWAARRPSLARLTMNTVARATGRSSFPIFPRSQKFSLLRFRWYLARWLETRLLTTPFLCSL